MSDPDRDVLVTAVLAVHTALDDWADAVRTAADTHPGDPERALGQPALGAAEQAWHEALDAFTGAAGTVLGLPDEDDEDDDDVLAADADPDDAVGVELYATVTGAGEGDPLLLVDAEGERLVAALEAAGWLVPEWGVRLVPVEDLSGDEDDLDE